MTARFSIVLSSLIKAISCRAPPSSAMVSVILPVCSVTARIPYGPSTAAKRIHQSEDHLEPADVVVAHRVMPVVPAEEEQYPGLLPDRVPGGGTRGREHGPRRLHGVLRV